MCWLNAISTEKCEAVIVFETQGVLAYEMQKPRKAFGLAGLERGEKIA
jgi:hypothetical protein